ncbi:putative entry exclusion protein TrbK-alt [Sphingomonas adhaesiva]|uniref:putative entry exclusion protein TrbK-alt n=1 Tax=Sphingomonas adhaesiva TaxID=28212 RepID=UPI003FA73B1D
MHARIGAIVFVAVAVTATAVEMTRKEEAPPAAVVVTVSAAPADPLRLALERCQFLGEAAARDPACLRTWAENRARFLGLDPAKAVPLAGSR